MGGPLLYSLIRRLGLVGLLVLLPVVAQATTYYLSPTGSDAINNGLSTGAPWLTFNRAMTGTPNVGCGDTLILMDGTYTTATHGSLNMTKVCTVNTVLLVQAQHQRAAWLKGDGSSRVVYITASAYVTVDGLRVTSADNNCSGTCGPTSGYQFMNVEVENHSNNVVLRNFLVSNNNRYQNTALIRFGDTTHSLIEDTEIYSWHRHGVVFGVGNSSNIPASNNVARRVYANSRGYADIAGGRVSDDITKGDAAFSNYSGSTNIFENCISEGTEIGFDMEALASAPNNKHYGDISLSDNFGFLFKSRGSTTAGQPQNSVIMNSVAITPIQVGMEFRGNINTQVTNATVYQSATNSGLFADANGSMDRGGGTYSVFVTNLLTTLNQKSGFSGFFIDSSIGSWTWSGKNINSFSNSVNFTPSSLDSHYTAPTSNNPQLGACRVWIPDASPMKGVGLSGADIGANILYRYVDGVLTTTPLWDPTTGVFPHGATVATVNDVVGSSAFDVSTRLNVNSGGCSFPSGYAGGTPPQNPTTYQSSTGTNSTSHSHTLAAGMKSLTVGVVLRALNGGVGSVTGVTGCGGEALTQLVTQVTASPTYERADLWGKLNPTTGTCTIAVTTTGTVDAMVTTSMAIDAISAYGATASGTNLSATPSVTVATNTGETIVDMVAGRKDVAVTAGANETLQMDTLHPTIDLRGTTSTKAGVNGGVMTYTFGGNTYWALAVVSLLPTNPNAPPTAVLTQSKFRWHGLYGTEALPVVLPFAAAAVNTNVVSHPKGMLRVRMELTASVADYGQTGLVLYCSPNSGAYARAVDTFGSNPFRLFGPGVYLDIPSSLVPTTQLLNSGNYVAGVILRSEPVPYTMPVLVNGNHTELEWSLVLNMNVGDTLDCRVYKDSGVPIDAYTVTPRVTIIAPQAGMGF